MQNYNDPTILAITGASGSIYGVRTLRVLAELGVETHLVLSKESRFIIKEELGISTPEGEGIVEALVGKPAPHVVYHPVTKMGAAIASGSFQCEGMVIVPCSMGCLGRIAAGVSSNLVERAADVTLKERRKLILVTRETPLNLVHLENMTKLTRAGAVVMPADPGFYHKPKTIEDLVDFVVMRILDQLGVPNDLVKRWKGQ